MSLAKAGSELIVCLMLCNFLNGDESRVDLEMVSTIEGSRQRYAKKTRRFRRVHVTQKQNQLNLYSIWAKTSCPTGL